MSDQQPDDFITEFTPLEKVEMLFNELSEWYGEADKKELRIAAKFLMVALDKFASHGGHQWQSLVMEYVDILKNDPDKFAKMVESNRGELKQKNPDKPYH